MTMTALRTVHLPSTLLLEHIERAIRPSLGELPWERRLRHNAFMYASVRLAMRAGLPSDPAHLTMLRLRWYARGPRVCRAVRQNIGGSIAD